MDFLQQAFSVRFEYKVYFTKGLFSPDNEVFRSFFKTNGSVIPKILFVVDDGVVNHHPNLLNQIRAYFSTLASVKLIDDIIVVPGGEQVKNSEEHFNTVVKATHTYGIDRHSYIAAIGGGSVLDVVGFASAVSHRGIRHIRIPTTVLSQNDSGVGVKNGINYFNKKNYLGSFAAPVAVFNDSNFLTTLDDAEWRSGISEAIKVALIKDAKFFEWIESNAARLVQRDMEAMHYLIHRCAEMHLDHIASGDPFEMGSSRPLDFGHWSAHKLEQLSDFSIRHGEAVATGIALDSAYSFLSGRLDEASMLRVVDLIERLGFQVTHPLLEVKDENSALLKGLSEFREHLGGRLTIMLLRAIGKGEEVNEMDAALVRRASEWLMTYSEA